jgi:transposase
MNIFYEKQIATLNEKLENMKEILDTERKEHMTFHKYTKKIANTENSNNILPIDHLTYVDEEYYKESIIINNLKIQISNLIKQNDILKNRNRELIEENEILKGEFRI